MSGFGRSGVAGPDTWELREIESELEIVSPGRFHDPSSKLLNIITISGAVKFVEKSGISQSDVNLKFKTKRLQSKLFGYVSRTDNSIGVNLNLDYKFVNRRSESVNLDLSLANRSKRIIAKYVGEAKVKTSAYPYMNFNTSLQFQVCMMLMPILRDTLKNYPPLAQRESVTD